MEGGLEFARYQLALKGFLLSEDKLQTSHPILTWGTKINQTNHYHFKKERKFNQIKVQNNC